MPTQRRFTVLAVLVVLLAVAATGCRKRSRRSSSSQGAVIFTTDSFPGDSVQNGNVADDQRAMSISGADFGGGFRCTFNGERDTALVTYLVDSLLYAHYYDGSDWTPPLTLGAADFVGGGIDGDKVIHAFLNTGNHSSDAAQERDGDAIILWTGIDADEDGGLTPDGNNRCLYATYFDVTFHDEPENNFGFQKFAQRVNSQDEVNEDVETIGVCSDGLVGEANWQNGRGAYKWGDETTSIVAFWHQLENNDADTPIEDEATYYVWFDLATAGDPATPLAPSVNSRISVVEFGASDTGIDSQETLVWNRYASYNGTLFMRVGADDAFGGSDNVLGRIRLNRNYLNQTVNEDDDITMQTTTFNLGTGSRSATASLHDGTPDATDAFENSSQFIMEDGGFFRGRHIFGTDEGLAVCVFPFVQVVNVPDESFFNDDTNNGRLAVAEIHETTGAVLGVENLDSEQVLADDNVEEGEIDMRLSRNGDYIWFAWREVRDIGGSDDNALWVNQYATTRPDEDGVFTLPALAASLSGPLVANLDTDGESVSWFAFQAGLTYICGSQSDPDVMNLFYEQSDGLNDEVFASRLIADVDGGAVSPVVSVTSVETFEDGIISSWSGVINDEGFNFRATDSGEGGNYIAFYIEDIDLPGSDFRLFAERVGLGAGTVEIDSSNVDMQVAGLQQIRTVLTPKGEDIGLFDTVTMEDDPERTHPTQVVHVFFAETESTELAGTGFALRTRRFRAHPDGGAIGDLFVPNAGSAFEAPFDLDLPFVDPSTSDDADPIGQGTEGLTVGLWFQELSHLYYQEFSIDDADSDEIGWNHIGGESDPFLIDDDNDEELEFFVELKRQSDTCESMEGTAIFWTKAYGSGGGTSVRLQVRIRDGNND